MEELKVKVKAEDTVAGASAETPHHLDVRFGFTAELAFSLGLW